MFKLRHLSYLVVFTLLPAGCSDSTVPVAPSAPAGGAEVAKVEPPKKTTKQTPKGPRTVHPGGGSTMEP